MENSLDVKLRNVLDSIGDGIYVTDGKGLTLFVNKAYEDISGIKLNEIKGISMYDLIEKGFFRKSASMMAIERREAVSIVESFSNQDRCLASAYPIFDNSGQISMVISIVRPMDSLNEMVTRIRASEKLNMHYAEELAKLWSNVNCEELIVGNSKSMQEVMEKAIQVADVDTTVLLTGETGVGKEIVAKEIHKKSLRSDKAFIKINCAAIPDSLFESEIFGYEKGAFTGALEGGKPGMLEMANNGTILLDEIGELSLQSQSKLLRVLQDQKIQRLGATKATQLNIRVISATNRDLIKMAEEGLFRMDLYYRLSVIPLRIPPLRERGQDILIFAKKYLDEFNLKYGLNKDLSLETAQELLFYSWPGNVRELKNFMERLILTSSTNNITREEVIKHLEDPEMNAYKIFINSSTYFDALEEVEKLFIDRAIQNNTNTRNAAAELGISQSTLVRKAQKYGIKKR